MLIKSIAPPFFWVCGEARLKILVLDFILRGFEEGLRIAARRDLEWHCRGTSNSSATVYHTVRTVQVTCKEDRRRYQSEMSRSCSELVVSSGK